ncbi:MAG: hypothetical protein FH753_09035 [Firmicutes bacterium]|nr:hypothetical protein [Bacillota bacterium]
MTHKIGVSGSTILSNPDKFEDLFLEKTDHIEIGEFPDEIAVNHFLDLCKEKKHSFGIHYIVMKVNMICLKKYNMNLNMHGSS